MKYIVVISCLLLINSFVHGQEQIKKESPAEMKNCKANTTDCLQKGMTYIYNREHAKAYSLFIYLCDSGMPEACNSIVEMLERGMIKTKEDPRNYALKACDLGSAVGCFNYAIYLEKDEKPNNAVEYNIKSCNLFYSRACEKVAVLYSERRDYSTAEAYFNKALKIVPTSRSLFYNMACMYSEKKDYVSALEYLKNAVTMESKYKRKAAEDVSFKSMREMKEFQDILK